jgi:hypothetical protein
VRSSIIALLFSVAVVGCNGGDHGPKRVSAKGATSAIVTDGANRVAYLLDAGTAIGSTGELHVADATGHDALVATGISAGGFVLAPGGKALLFAQLLSGGNDASLSYLDLGTPGAQPRVLFAHGIGVQTAPTGSTTYTAPLSQIGFFTPSGRYYIVGVLPPNVAVSPDLHVIDTATGDDVFVRDHGAFDYLELALPDDTMIFQDAVGGNDGPSGAPGVQTLFWISLPAAGSSQPATIDTRTTGLLVSGDNQTLIYLRVDGGLFAWDTMARPATGTPIASDALNFAVADHGQVAYLAKDGGIHVVSPDGTALADAAAAQADPYSPVVISADGSDVYYFQKVETQNARGTLMHLAATAGATPTQIAPAASLYDVHPVADGLLYLQNVDDVGQLGDAVRAARDGSGATALGTQIPFGSLQVVTPKSAPTPWLSAHLTAATIDASKMPSDGGAAVVGAQALAGSALGAGEVAIDPSVRAGQFALSDDQQSLAYIGGTMFDIPVNNYVGVLTERPVAMAAPKPNTPLVGVSELGAFVGHSLFVNAPKAPTPGVYFVTF